MYPQKLDGHDDLTEVLMILVDWMQSLLISLAVKTHEDSQEKSLAVLEERIQIALEL